MTRQRVIEQAAPVFNQRGYWGSSFRDVMDATGLEKGGIYNHFRSKDELAAAAFDYNVELVGARIRAALAGRHQALDRLRAVLEVYRGFVVDPPFVGGCPIMNAATDTDDTHPMLRRKVQQAMARLRDDTIARVVARGVERGELQAGTDPATVATVVVCTLEGALMLCHLYDDPGPMAAATAHLDQYLTSLSTEAEP